MKLKYRMAELQNIFKLVNKFKKSQVPDDLINKVIVNTAISRITPGGCYKVVLRQS